VVLAKRFKVLPLHTGLLLLAVGAGGVGFTVIETVVVEVHEPAVPVMVYEVLIVGEANTIAPVVAERPVAGNHV
jgi:hypothetical protein